MEQSNLPGAEPGREPGGEPVRGPEGESSGEEDALRRLQAHLDRASGTAERLLAEAARASVSSAGRVAEAATRRAGANPAGSEGVDWVEGVDGVAAAEGVKPPPRGWQIPHYDRGGRISSDDLKVLATVLHSLGDLIPPDLQRRVAEALRELLLALRALIDWYLERAQKRRAAPPEVEDIPIQ